MKYTVYKIINIMPKFVVYVFLFLLTMVCIFKLSAFIPYFIQSNTCIQMTIFIIMIIVWLVLYIYISVVLFNFFKKIKCYTAELSQYNTSKKYHPYQYSDKEEYPKIYGFKVAGRVMYNAITICDKFLDTGINIVKIIKQYIPDANDKLLSNVLSYINSYYKKRMNKESYYIDKTNNYCIMQVKFENKDTVLFLTISQQYGCGNIERTYEKLQEYSIVTNNN